MVRVSQAPYHFELKEIQFKLIFCFISINSALICAGQSVTNVCSICNCNQYQTKIDCYNLKLTSVPKAIPATVESLYLNGNHIRNIEKDAFKDLINLNTLDLSSNKLTNIEKDAFKDLINLKTIYLEKNKLTNIEEDTFKNLVNLEYLYLERNQIKTYEDGAFLFLPSITYIDLSDNDNMTCECHLPAIVDYMKRTYNRSVDVQGKCRNNQMELIKILEYSECKDYSLFQLKLQCKTCSGITCNDSEVTSCPGEEPVCKNRISMSGVTLKSDKSCSTYRECVAVKKHNRFPCNKLTNGTSCVTCCTGNVCNKNDFIAATMKEPTEIEARLEKLEKLIAHLVEMADSMQSQSNDVYIDIYSDTTLVRHSHM